MQSQYLVSVTAGDLCNAWIARYQCAPQLIIIMQYQCAVHPNYHAIPVITAAMFGTVALHPLHPIIPPQDFARFHIVFGVGDTFSDLVKFLAHYVHCAVACVGCHNDF